MPNLIDFLRGRRKKQIIIPHSSEDLFVPIDIEKVNKQIGVEKRAKESAAHDLPSSNAKNLDANESKIVLSFKEELKDISSRIHDKKIAINDSIYKLNIGAEVADLRNFPENIQHLLKNKIVEFRERLTSVKSQKEALEKEFINFKNENELTRSPEYPESKFLFIAILGAIIVIEFLCNGYFFSKGSDLGLVGGISQASIVAVINVFNAFLIGLYLFPNVNHNSIIRKVLGYFSLLFLVITVISYNLLVAHFRDQLSIDASNAIKSTIDSFFNNPVSLNSFDSWLLCFLGCIFAIIAFIDGYTFDDKYPGFGSLDRRKLQAQDDYSVEREAIAEEIKLLYSESEAALLDIVENIKSNIGSLNSLILLKESLAFNFDQHNEHLNDGCNVVLQFYRDSNEKNRNSPVPSYFRERCDITRNENIINEDEVQRDKDFFAKEKSKLHSINTEVPLIKNKVSEIYRNSFNSLTDLDDFFLKSEGEISG